jgi:hypothetical protein
LIWTQTVDVWDYGDGISVGVGCGNNYGCTFTQTFDRTFTVTSPGLFDLSTLDDFGVTAYSCTPGGCESFAEANGDVTNVNSIIGPVSFNETAANSGESIQPCNGAPYCGTGVNFEATADGLLFLPLGDYTLQDEITYAIGSGEIFGGVDVDATLVPAAVPTRSRALPHLYWSPASWRSLV